MRTGKTLPHVFSPRWANGFLGYEATKANLMEIPALFWVVHFCLPEAP